jgi:hypothetical protein
MKKLFLFTLMAIAIQAQAQNVGIGNPAPNEKLDVTGNINVTGTIKANGVDGTANQVLAKNASNNMAWVNTAHANNTRFKVKFEDNIADNDGYALINNVSYNLNGANISFSTITNRITINKTGLYHFDIALKAFVTTTINPVNNPYYTIFLYNEPAVLAVQDFDIGNFTPTNSNNSSWTLRGNQSFDINITAPTSINLYYQITNGNKTYIKCELNGHLISE